MRLEEIKPSWLSLSFTDKMSTILAIRVAIFNRLGKASRKETMTKSPRTAKVAKAQAAFDFASLTPDEIRKFQEAVNARRTTKSD